MPEFQCFLIYHKACPLILQGHNSLFFALFSPLGPDFLIVCPGKETDAKKQDSCLPFQPAAAFPLRLDQPFDLLSSLFMGLFQIPLFQLQPLPVFPDFLPARPEHFFHGPRPGASPYFPHPHKMPGIHAVQNRPKVLPELLSKKLLIALC